MAFISNADRNRIIEHFDSNLVGNVEIVMFTQRESPIIIPFQRQCETCGDTKDLLEEVASLSDRLTLTVHDIGVATDEAADLGIDRVPAFVLKGSARGRVRFFGIPSGYEFSALIADLVDTSKGTTDLSDETRVNLAGLTENVNIKVFTTPN